MMIQRVPYGLQDPSILSACCFVLLPEAEVEKSVYKVKTGTVNR